MSKCRLLVGTCVSSVSVGGVSAGGVSVRPCPQLGGGRRAEGGE